jgi:hypothetical protein
MKRFLQTQFVVVGLLLATFTIASPAAVPPGNPSRLAAELVGTWQLVSFNYLGLRQTLSRDKVCLKAITPTHYTRIYYLAASRETIATSGGRYSLTANSCTEKVDFLQGVEADFRSVAYKTCYTFPSDLEQMLRAEQCLYVDVRGDVMRVLGISANGYPIEEIWQRVK